MSAPLPIIDLSYNWNGKLFCNCFTTIRLRNDTKYVEGREYDVTLKHQHNGPVIILDIIHFKLSNLTESMARLDTGYSKKEATELFHTMYKNFVHDWDNQFLSFILLQRLKPDTTQETPPTL